MELPLPLDKMRFIDKLRALEEIWEDLCRTPQKVPSPSWHQDVLRVREKRANKRASRFHDWSDAKKSIRDSIK
ncbi:MAG: addiction module protein [Myxococcota bacterium]|nr:addiction module protein [Myxococcota bacterium]